MSSRALSLATVLLLIGAGSADTAQAQNLEAGKSPSQIFAQTCTACHKSARGLLKTVSPGSLPGFLRQHYTTSSDMAGLLASYLVSNGAADTRYGSGEPRGGKAGAREKEKEANSSATQASPDHIDRFGRRTRPSQEAARPVEGQSAAERAPEGRKAKHRLSKRGKPEPEEAPKAETPKDMPAAGEPAVEDTKAEPKSDTAKVESGKDEAKSSSERPAGENRPEGVAKPDGGALQSAKTESSRIESGKTEPARSEPAKSEPAAGEAPALRPDPVPPVTPAAKPAETTKMGAPEPPPAKAQDAPSPVTATAPGPATSK